MYNHHVPQKIMNRFPLNAKFFILSVKQEFQFEFESQCDVLIKI